MGIRIAHNSAGDGTWRAQGALAGSLAWRLGCAGNKAGTGQEMFLGARRKPWQARWRGVSEEVPATRLVQGKRCSLTREVAFSKLTGVASRTLLTFTWRAFARMMAFSLLSFDCLMKQRLELLVLLGAFNVL